MIVTRSHSAMTISSGLPCGGCGVIYSTTTRSCACTRTATARGATET